MFTGADTWLSRASRDDTVNTTDGPPGAWVFNPCLENERVENGVCAPCSGGGTRAAGDDPAPGDTGCTFPDSAALKTAVDNCLAVDPTGVACCSHGADCGAAGTAEMPDWDVSLVTEHERAVQGKASFNADISRWEPRRHDHDRCSGQRSTDIDGTSVTTMRMFYDADAFNQDIGTWDVSVTTCQMFAAPTRSTKISANGIPRASRP